MDNAPIREAVEHAVASGDYTYSSICRSLGWTRKRVKGGIGDTSRLKRGVGLLPSKDSSGNCTVFTRTMRYDNAVRVVRAIDRDPVEFGL